MCNHIYTAKIRKYKGRKVPCFFNSIANNTDYFPDGLLHDSEGKCIFHSENLMWKSQHQFSNILLNTIDKLDKDDAVKEIDLDETIIADHNVDVLMIELKTVKRFSMNKAKIFNPLTFKSADFGNQLNCKKTVFLGKTKMIDTKLDSCEFSKCVFKKAVSIDKCNFSGTYTSFEDSVFEESIKISGSRFAGMAFFSDVKFLENGWLSWATFMELVFEQECNFDRCFSACSFTFQDIMFRGKTDFKELVFSKVKNHSNHSVKPYSFKKITIDKNAVLSFIGTERENNIFQDQVEFEFVDEIKGKVIFDNMNFRFITKKSRDEILKLEKLGKIEIGEGCIKYRHQTKLKHLDIETDGQQIILEIAQTFANYFVSHNGVNLGIEVVEKTSDTLVFFYYSDEDITSEEFHEMLKTTEEYLWSSLLLNPNNTGKSLATKHPADMKKYFDGVFSLMSIFQKIGFRIALNEWNKFDTKHLMSALELGGRIPFSNGDLHLLISKSSTVENTKNFLGKHSYKQLYAENTLKSPYGNQDKIVNTAALEELVLKQKFEACINILLEVTNSSRQIQREIKDLKTGLKTIEENLVNGVYLQDDYEREISRFEYRFLQFLTYFDEEFNTKIEKEGIAVLPKPSLKSREIGQNAPNIIHLAYDEIIHITSLSKYKNYVDIYTTNGTIYHKRISLKQLEGKLPDAFLHIEKSYVLNMKFWKGATSNFTFAFFHQAKTKDEKIPIGREYVNTLRQYLENRY